jgi:uncharacterized membrane protein
VSRSVSSAPTWAVVATFLLSVAGLALSVYLSVAHFVGTQIIACPANHLFDCDYVTTSSESYFLGIPVALLGAGFFVVMSVLNSPWSWKRDSYRLQILRLSLSLVGMCFALWLVSAEIVILGRICIYCTGVHIVMFSLFLVLTRVTPAQLGWTRKRT